MFVFTIILGLSLYPGHCSKANDAISTRRQSRDNQLYYNNTNYQPSQDIYYNNEASRNSNYNHEASQKSGQNSSHNNAPSRNSNSNYTPSQNSSNNDAPSQNSNNNYAPSKNSSNNDAPSQNSNNNNAPSQNANQLNFNSYKEEEYLCATNLIQGYPVPVVTVNPEHSDELSRDHQTINNIDKYHDPPFNVTPNPKLPSSPQFPPFDNSQNEKGVEFPDIESRFDMAVTAASPDDLGADANSGLPEMGRERFQWQVSVFSKDVSPHVRVCGGSLVTSSAIISAAQCFWSRGPLSAELFAVGAGETAPGQANHYEAYQYQRNVRDIRLPPRFRGDASSFQDDLGVAVLAGPLPPALRPVCVSFDWELEERQLAEGSEGTLLYKKMEELNLYMRNQRVPYIGVEECLREFREDQLRYVTSDKFCAGYRGPVWACYPDTGSGLVYFHDSIPFLRGVLSRRLGNMCVNGLTHVGAHREFLLRHVGGLEAECARHYPGARGAVKKGGEEFVCNCYC